MKPDAAPVTIDPVERDRNSDLSELTLWMGRLLMNHGAESERVEQTMRGCLESFGSRISAVLVTYDALILTEQGQQGSTVLCRARPTAVDMSMIEEISHLSHRIGRRELQNHAAREALQRIESAPRHYTARLTGLSIAVACAAFSRLFQGDWGAFGVTFVGSGAAMLMRHYYARRNPNRLFFAGASAFVAACVVGILQRLTDVSRTPGAAYAACALMVVPGVPAINAVQDLIKGHLGVAVARAAETALIILAGTLGIWAGLGLSWARW